MYLAIVLAFCTVVVMPIWLVESLYDDSVWNTYKRYKAGREAYPTAIPLTFRQFKSYYDLCPQEYHDIKGADPKETIGVIGYQRDCGRATYSYAAWKHMIVFRSFQEYLTYVRFLKEQEREAAIKLNEEEYMKTVENATVYYQEVIKDIERLKARAEQEKQKAQEMVLQQPGYLR